MSMKLVIMTTELEILFEGSYGYIASHPSEGEYVEIDGSMYEVKTVTWSMDDDELQVRVS